MFFLWFLWFGFQCGEGYKYNSSTCASQQGACTFQVAPASNGSQSFVTETTFDSSSYTSCSPLQGSCFAQGDQGAGQQERHGFPEFLSMEVPVWQVEWQESRLLPKVYQTLEFGHTTLQRTQAWHQSKPCNKSEYSVVLRRLGGRRLLAAIAATATISQTKFQSNWIQSIEPVELIGPT